MKSFLLKHVKHTFLVLTSLTLLGLSHFASATNEAIVVYTQITGHHVDHTPAFRAIVKKSLDDLNRFEVIKGIKGTVSSSKPLQEKLDAARKAGIPWLAEVTFDTEKRKGKLNFEIYRSNGENVFRWKEKIDIDNLKAFLAQMEYQMPLKLRINFLELGHVIKNDNRLVYFDLGETAGVQPGDIYQIYEEGQEIEDDDGNSFGFLEKTTGIVKVTQVTSVYSIGEIIIGKLSIDSDQWVKRAKNQDLSTYQGTIEAVLENQVAINIGKNVGVEEGSYYAVFREIKPINEDESFRHPVGHIKINEVFDEFSKGELSISDTFELTKYTIKKGDRVEEVESPRKNMWSFNQIMTNVSSETGARVLNFGYQRDSMVNVNMVYRFKGGYGNGNPYLSGGVMHSMGHSAHVFMGMDVVYAGDAALNLFISVDVDTPLSRNFKINLESGFMVAHNDDNYNGLNTSIGLKYAYNLF